MASHEDFLYEDSAESDSGPSPSNESGVDERPTDQNLTVECGQDLLRAVKSHPVVVAAVTAGVAAAVVGVKIAYDRRKAARSRNRVLHHLEDARETLLAVAAELPERGRAVLHRATRR